ncbi:hypothetical protein JCM10295v2_001827 [Rhodotorula toruloides]
MGGFDAGEERRVPQAQGDPFEAAIEEAGAPAVELKAGCQIQVLKVRTIVRVRRAISTSRLAPPARRVPKRSVTRLVPLRVDVGGEEKNPFEEEAYVEGLRQAGYLEPLDVSRKAIKARFTRGLQKEEFKANLEAFLAQEELKALGDYMVRFKGTATQSWTPYVSLFTTSLPTSTSPRNVFPDSDTNSLSTWTPLPASTENSRTSEWACKARKFWPVRVVCEGPADTDIVPDTAPEIPPPERRRRRRDTFQEEIDLDAELRERERAEAMELKTNTDLNSLTNSQLVKLKVDTDVHNSKSRSEKDDAPRSVDSQLSTPTILASLQQLGYSVVATVTPAVQSLPGRISDIKEWFAHRQLPAPFSEDMEREEEELERRKKEKRRRRREKERRNREEEERAAATGEEQAAEDLEREHEERRKRREERRRRQAEEEGRV